MFKLSVLKSAALRLNSVITVGGGFLTPTESLYGHIIQKKTLNIIHLSGNGQQSQSERRRSSEIRAQSAHRAFAEGRKRD